MRAGTLPLLLLLTLLGAACSPSGEAVADRSRAAAGAPGSEQPAPPALLSASPPQAPPSGRSPAGGSPSAGSPNAADPPPGSTACRRWPAPLPAAEPRARRLAGGACDEAPIELAAGGLVDLRVDQRGADVVVRLFDPVGGLVAEIDTPKGRITLT